MSRNIEPKMPLEANIGMQTESEFRPVSWFRDLWFVLFLVAYSWNLQTKINWQPQHYQTVDGHYYMQLADKLLAGKAFEIDEIKNRSGRSFSPYPPGYPVLLAVGHSESGLPYSKIALWLNVGFLALLAVFWRRFAPLWTLALAFSTDTAMELACYTWSEFPFVVVLICIALASSRSPTNSAARWLSLALAVLAFLLRFASVFLFLFWGILMLFSGSFPFKRSNHTIDNQFSTYKPWLWLLFTFGGFVLIYFGLEWAVFGQPTGGDRYPNMESSSTLFHALCLEMFNQVCLFKDFTGSSSASFLWGISMQILFTVWVFVQKNRRVEPDRKSILAHYLILLGMCYWAFMVPVRWYFYFAESFDFRLLGPGGILIFLGLLVWFSNQYTVKRLWLILTFILGSSFFFSLPKREIFLHYQEWFWLKHVKPGN